MILEEIKKLKTDRKELRKFGVTIAIALGLLGGLLLYKESSKYVEFWGVGLLFLILGFLLPELLKPFYKVWMIFAITLGWFNTRLLLGIIFFLMFTPMGLIMRLLGKDLLDQKFIQTRTNLEPVPTYWKKREKAPLDKTRYERLF